MEIKTAVDMDLRNVLEAELRTLREYEAMFDDMTMDEKRELHDWLANGRSVNSNPNLLYGENGCLLDFINARRMDEDMVANPDHYR